MPAFLDQQHLHSFLVSLARLAIWLLLLIAIFVPLERVFALHPQRFFRKGLLQDLAYYFVNGIVPGLLLALPMSLAAFGGHAIMPERVHAAIANLPLWQRALAGLIVGETGFYWGHRWAHELPLLWRFHSIHHSAEHIYFLTSSRAHPVDNAFNKLCGFIPVYILGIATPLTPDGGAVAAILVLIMTMWGFFIHANLRWRLGPLEWIIATPAFHHWHHTLGEQRDLNYAPMLPVMDWVFGTLHLPRKQWPLSYGIEKQLPESLAGQIMYPLHPLPPEHPAKLTATDTL